MCELVIISQFCFSTALELGLIDTVIYFRSEDRIVFVVVENFGDVKLNLCLKPRKPGLMTTATPSTLIYVDQSDVDNGSLILRWMDCSTMQPRHVSGKYR